MDGREQALAKPGLEKAVVEPLASLHPLCARVLATANTLAEILVANLERFPFLFSFLSLTVDILPAVYVFLQCRMRLADQVARSRSAGRRCWYGWFGNGLFGRLLTGCS